MYEWLHRYKFHKLKAKSFDTLEGTYENQVLKSRLARIQVQAIDGDQLQEFFNGLVKSGLSKSTQKKTYSLLNQFFKYVYAKQPYNNPILLVEVTFTNPTEIEAEELIVMDDEEIERFCAEAARTFEIGVGGYIHGQLLIFLLWSFMRIGEGLALQYKDIDEEERTCSIYKTYSRVKVRDGESTDDYEWQLTIAKTYAGRRVVDLCEEAMKALKVYKGMKQPESEEDFIFTTMEGSLLYPSNLRENLQSILTNAKIGKKITIHGLRHTGISYFIRHGVPVEVVSRLAGHKSVDITYKVYYSVIQQQKRKAIEKIDSLRKNVG